MKNQPIDAYSYKRIIDGLLETLDKVLESNSQAMELFIETGNEDLAGYAAGLAKAKLCRALKKRILSDLAAAQEEVNSFEGFDA